MGMSSRSRAETIRSRTTDADTRAAASSTDTASGSAPNRLSDFPGPRRHDRRVR